MEQNRKLNPERIIQTAQALELRIADRFPESGLRRVCNDVIRTAQETKQKIEWINKPHLSIRLGSYLVILIGIVGLVLSITYVDFSISDTTLSGVVGVIESVFNDILLLGAAIFFLISMESRIKRTRTMKSLHELRALIHVIDMHQLTKDPYLILNAQTETEHSPKRTLTKFELERYLDYCSEMSALIAKIGALYAQAMEDDKIVQMVSDVESLSSELNTNIWQKIMILHNHGNE